MHFVDHSGMDGERIFLPVLFLFYSSYFSIVEFLLLYWQAAIMNHSVAQHN